MITRAEVGDNHLGPLAQQFVCGPRTDAAETARD